MAVVNEVAVPAPTPGIDMSNWHALLCRALATSCPPKLGGTGAHAAPSFKNRSDDTRKLLPDRQAGAGHCLRTFATFPSRNDQADVFMSLRLWLENSVVILASLMCETISMLS